MPKAFAALFVASLCLAACHTTHPPLPSGRGLVTVDHEPPADAATYAAPSWKVGDRFVYRKGGLSRLAFRLESTVDGVHRLVDEQGEIVMKIGEDLSDRGQEKPGDPKAGVAYDPADFELTWPMWKGKRWSCSFVSRGANHDDIPLLVTYECDAAEDVTVPAGTFHCLRIWRRARLAAPGHWIDRISIAWYSPQAGAFVRRLNDSLLTELEEIDRQ
jgi:hypothetical protein